MSGPPIAPECIGFNDQDLALALGELESFVDITPEDLREIYLRAGAHARARCAAAPPVPAAAVPAAPAAGFLAKMRGGGHAPPAESLREIAWSWLGAVLGIAACGLLSAAVFEPRETTLLIGSFGASAVLVYAAIRSPLAQPRNLVGGHVVSALVGVASWQVFGGTLWLAAALGVSLAITAMLATRTLHPPGGATALIAVIGGPKIHALGFLYVLVPAGLGALVLLVIALAVNNAARGRRYPEYWW
ncbi:MAG TPA: HPP family protein [Candidatus Methanoperedens sp.]|nr:HPP family protein [Candidatus Methanoperedens sp.]